MSATDSDAMLNAQFEADVEAIDACWRACNYLAAGMIFLQDNPLLREPLRPEHIKRRLLGHWGSSPGLAFIYVHLSYWIQQHDTSMLFMAGPGHGAPGVLAPVYLEGTYSETYPSISEDATGLQRLFKRFSFPGGIGSHCTPELPGSIHEGGELGYCLSHATGAAFDNPDLIVAAVIGDGEAETGPMATSWHSGKFLNPLRDGAVLPILHLNGYKINNPTLLSRIPEDELRALFVGYGWEPVFVSGHEPDSMHRQMAAAVKHCITVIQQHQQYARGQGQSEGQAARVRWPMIVLRSPKGWTGPTTRGDHYLENYWRSHQVPLPAAREDAQQRQQLLEWLQSYRPQELFDEQGQLFSHWRRVLPAGGQRMSASLHANGGILRRDLNMPDFRSYQQAVPAPGQVWVANTLPLGELLRDIMRANPTTFRVFGPDETTSNKLHPVYAATDKLWLLPQLPEDADEGHLGPAGRVLEMLSEHTLEGWLEGYLLSGRHGFFATYEAFVHVIDSMFNQHAKWLAIAAELPWRAPIPSLNLLITSTVWRQDHNGFTHQDPGFLSLVLNKSPDVVRAYLPPDANCLLSVSDHCLRSRNLVNVIVCDKQAHLQYLSMDEAIAHCHRGLGIWDWASNDEGAEPDLVIVGCGDVPTREALAAVELLHEHCSGIKIRFINVVDLFRLASVQDHPHGLSDADFDTLFTCNRPVIFNFHGYPWLIHRLTYQRANHANFHVKGYQEHGNINTPLELAIINGIDRFSVAIEAINRLPMLRAAAAQVKQTLQDRQLACRQYAYAEGVDRPEESEWTWHSK